MLLFECNEIVRVAENQEIQCICTRKKYNVVVFVVDDAVYLCLKVLKWKIPLGSNVEIVDIALNSDASVLSLVARDEIVYFIPILHLSRLQQKKSQQDRLKRDPVAMRIKMTDYLYGQTLQNSKEYTARDAFDTGTVQLAEGLVSQTCITWWDSSDGTPYVLIGCSNGLISFVDARKRQEMCRCELLQAGSVECIDLVYETFENERRTSMLVQCRNSYYFKVGLERQFINSDQPPRTFPFDFQSDSLFRPKRITRFPTQATLFVIQNKAIGVFDPSTQRFSIYTNLKWRLQREFIIPPGVSRIKHASLTLLLVEMDETEASAWIALPPDSAGAVIVEDLNSYQGVLESSYLWTRERVYTCHPKWSKLLLFKKLTCESISLEKACGIGHALSIDMRALTEIVANGLCEQRYGNIDWIIELYQYSNADPLHIVTQLVDLNQTSIALEMLHRLLETSKDRQPLAHLYLSYCTVQEKLHFFIQENQDYETKFAIQELKKRNDIQSLLLVGCIRNALDQVVIIPPTFQLDRPEYVELLVSPACRPFLRSLSVSQQIQLLIQYPSQLMLHRDWIQRNIESIPLESCEKLVELLDPRTIETKPNVVVDDAPISLPHSFDSHSSETWTAEPYERFEFLLCLLLRLNRDKDLIEFFQRLPNQYRPAVMALRCFDMARPDLLQSIYASHGAWVLAQLEASEPCVDEMIRRNCDSIPLVGKIVLNTSDLDALVFKSLESKEFWIPKLVELLFDYDPIKRKNGVLEHQKLKYVVACRREKETLYSSRLLSEILAFKIKKGRSRSSVSLETLVAMVLTNMRQQIDSNEYIKCHSNMMFSCGHGYDSSETFHHRILPEFIKQLNHLPLYNTKKFIMEEYQQRRDQISQLACPTCVMKCLV